MLTAHRNKAAKYWERRRIVFNGLLLLAASFGWGISNAFNVGIDDIPGARVTDPGVLFGFLKIFAYLNIGFCLGYAAEFIWMSDEPRKLWPMPLRPLLLIVLCAVSMWHLSSRAGAIAKEAAYHKSGVSFEKSNARPEPDGK